MAPLRVQFTVTVFQKRSSCDTRGGNESASAVVARYQFALPIVIAEVTRWKPSEARNGSVQALTTSTTGPSGRSGLLNSGDISTGDLDRVA